MRALLRSEAPFSGAKKRELSTLVAYTRMVRTLREGGSGRICKTHLVETGFPGSLFLVWFGGLDGWKEWKPISIDVLSDEVWKRGKDCFKHYHSTWLGVLSTFPPSYKTQGGFNATWTTERHTHRHTHTHRGSSTQLSSYPCPCWIDLEGYKDL